MVDEACIMDVEGAEEDIINDGLSGAWGCAEMDDDPAGASAVAFELALGPISLFLRSDFWWLAARLKISPRFSIETYGSSGGCPPIIYSAPPAPAPRPWEEDIPLDDNDGPPMRFWGMASLLDE